MKFANPTTDFAFKKLFADPKHQDLLVSFLNGLLEREGDKRIVAAIVTDPNNLPLVRGDRHSIVDVRCTDESGRQYIIEVQVEDEKDFGQRCVYYSARALALQLKKRQGFQELLPVIFLGILNFNLFEHKDYISHLCIMKKKTHDVAFDLLEWHFAELSKFNKPESKITTEADRWLYLFKHAEDLETVPPSLAKSEETNQAMEVLNKHLWSKKELETYDFSIDAERIARNVLETALAKGKTEGKAEVAQQMLAKGIDIALIAEFTGLSVEQIELLKK